MKRLAVGLLLLALGACGDDPISPCDKSNLPIAPFEWAQRFIEGDRLEWRWQICPATPDCVICYDFTEVWQWDRCQWRYVTTITDEVRCHP